MEDSIVMPGSAAAAAPPPAERPCNGAADQGQQQLQVEEQPGDDVEAGLRQAPGGDVLIPRQVLSFYLYSIYILLAHVYVLKSRRLAQILIKLKA
jgi:hypothetical protein